MTGSVRTSAVGIIWNTVIELQKKILRLLKDNNGEMEEEKICTLLGIDAYEVPWGYNIGWARCLQSNQKHHLVLSEKITDEDIGHTGVM